MIPDKLKLGLNLIGKVPITYRLSKNSENGSFISIFLIYPIVEKIPLFYIEIKPTHFSFSLQKIKT
jgi:hypothetical protein